MQLSPTLRNLAAAVALLSAAASGGDHTNWRSIPIPPTILGPPDSIGETVTYQTPGFVHLFSGVTKQWIDLPVASLGFFEQYNDYAVIQDGTLLHGFSTRKSTVDTISTSGSPTIMSGPVSSSWVTLVADGLQAWGFSALRGEWVPLTLSQPGPTMLSQRQLGLLRDGSTVYGFSAHHGTFVPVAADAQAQLLLTGESEVGTAHSPGVFRAFSTHQNTWATAPIGLTATHVLRGEFALAVDGLKVTACSGITGTIATYTAAGTIASLASDEGVACFVESGNAVCYASGRGVFASKPATTPSFTRDYHFLFVVEPGKVTPFSSLTGAYGPSIAGSFGLTTNDAIGFADGAGADYAYSPILNDWTVAPVVSPVGPPVLVRNSVIIPHTGGYAALSARYGDWVSQAAAVPGFYSAPATGSTFLALDGDGSIAHVFDARLDRFATVIGSAPLQVQISRHTLMAHDGTTAYGFAQPTGRWDVVSLEGSPVIQFDTASSIGFVETGSDLHVYSALGSFSYEGRFPEFTRAIPLGNVLRLHQVGPASSSVVVMLAGGPAHVDLGLLLGTLFLDPSSLVVLPIVGSIPFDGHLEMDIPLPQSPVLIGVQPHLQTYVDPPAAPPYLGTSVVPVLF